MLFIFQCYEWALRKCQQLDWSEESAKAFVMIGDCLPHPPSYTDQSIYWGTELDVLTGMGVKVDFIYFTIILMKIYYFAQCILTSTL